jgi:hypothetical protein
MSSHKTFRLAVFILGLCIVGQGTPIFQVANPAPSHLAQPGSQPSFSVTIKAVHDTVQAKAPLMLEVVTANISDRDLTLWQRTAPDLAGWVYSADVRDESGNIPPSTAWGRRPMGEGSEALLNLKPGQTNTDIIDITQLYDFSQPGTYTIQVQRNDDENNLAIKSNTIKVIITPSKTTHAAPLASIAPGVEPAFSLTVKALNHPVSRVSGVQLEVITENTSDHDVLLWAEKAGREQAGVTYMVDIHGSTGIPPDTEFGRLSRHRAAIMSAASRISGAGGDRLVLRPGESWADSISVSKLYDLSQPGEYNIQVQRFDPATEAMVKSNIVKVTVTP